VLVQQPALSRQPNLGAEAQAPAWEVIINEESQGRAAAVRTKIVFPDLNLLVLSNQGDFPKGKRTFVG